MSYSKLKRVEGGKSPHQAVLQLTALVSIQKYPPAMHSNTSLPIFIVSLCVTWALTISGHRDTAYARFEALYPVTGVLLPTPGKAHAHSQWPHCNTTSTERQEPRKEESSHRGTATCRLTHSPWAKLDDAHHHLRWAHEATFNCCHVTAHHPAIPQTSHPTSLPCAFPFALTETQCRQMLLRVTSATHWLHFPHSSD